MGPIAHTYHVFRVQQCIRVLEHVLFRQRVQMVDNNARPDGLSVSYHPVGDLVVFARKVTPSVPHNDPVPELPPLSRLVKALVQPPVKAKGIVSNRTVQLQIVEAVFKRRILAKLSIGFHKQLTHQQTMANAVQIIERQINLLCRFSWPSISSW